MRTITARTRSIRVPSPPPPSTALHWLAAFKARAIMFLFLPLHLKVGELVSSETVCFTSPLNPKDNKHCRQAMSTGHWKLMLRLHQK